MKSKPYKLGDNIPDDDLDSLVAFSGLPRDNHTASHVFNCVTAIIYLTRENSAEKAIGLKECDFKDDVPVLSAISIDSREGVFMQLLSSLTQPQRLHLLHYDEDKSTVIYFAFPCVFIVTESMNYKYHVGIFHRILDRCEK